LARSGRRFAEREERERRERDERDKREREREKRRVCVWERESDEKRERESVLKRAYRSSKHTTNITKHNGQLSFLHVYHHLTIFMFYWINCNIGYDGDM
jgi:hypothetical protein